MTVKVKLTRAFDGGPLVVVESGGLGEGAELRPPQLRACAAALVAAADEAERRTLTRRGKPTPDEHRTFGVVSATHPQDTRG